jgi:hypothetical protein
MEINEGIPTRYVESQAEDITKLKEKIKIQTQFIYTFTNKLGYHAFGEHADHERMNEVEHLLDEIIDYVKDSKIRDNAAALVGMEWQNRRLKEKITELSEGEIIWDGVEFRPTYKKPARRCDGCGGSGVVVIGS